MKQLLFLAFALTSCTAGKLKNGKVWDEYIGHREFRINLDCRNKAEVAQTKVLKKCAELTLREEYHHFTLKSDPDDPEMTICTLHNPIDKPKGAHDAEGVLRLCDFMQNRFKRSSDGSRACNLP